MCIFSKVFCIILAVLFEVLIKMDFHSTLSTGPCKVVDRKALYCENFVPNNVPDPLSEVVLDQLPQDAQILNQNLLNGAGWRNVKSLVIKHFTAFNSKSPQVIFMENCFANLKTLEKLCIHITKIWIHHNAFLGLDKVKHLDISNCSELSKDGLHSILDTGLFPNLQTLIMQYTGFARGGLSLNNHFWRMVSDRPISYLDLSYSRVTEVNATSLLDNCKAITTLIFRGVRIGQTEFPKFHSYVQPCGFLYLDLTESIFASSYCLAEIFQSLVNVSLSLHDLYIIANAETIIADNVCGTSEPGIFHNFKNIRNVRLSSRLPFHLKHLSIDQNNLVYIDIELLCDKPVLEYFSASGNLMEYLNPKTLSCIKTLMYLDLSDNKLGLMLKRNITQFGKLLLTFHDLRHVSFAGNNLKSIPKDMFINNSKLEKVNISKNQLEQMLFEIENMKHLKILDLSNNAFEVFDEKSINKLASLLVYPNASILLHGNPFSCGKCEHYDRIHWMWLNSKRLHNLTNTFCTNRNGRKTKIDKVVVDNLKEICDSPETIAIYSCSGLIALCVVVCLTFTLKRSLHKMIQGKRMKETLQKIRENEKGFRYVVYLAHSSRDSDIVDHHIVPVLQQQLLKTTGVSRDLVCLGDQNFRPGFSIHDETIRYFNKCAVVLCVVTENFCTSDYCMVEFSQAIELRKPVILMIEEDCDEELMPPGLKSLFKNNARIIWSINNSQFMIKSTWEIVCHSIIE